MYCGDCGARNPEGSLFCNFCGAKLTPTIAAASERAVSQVPGALRPMAVGDILDETIRLFRQNFRVFVGIAAVLQVPLAVLQMVKLAVVGPNFLDFANFGRAGQFPVGLFVFWIGSSFAIGILSLLFFVTIQGALASAISRRYLDREISIGGAYRVALARFWRMLGATLLIGLVLLIVAITIIGIPLAVFLGIRWSFVVQAIVLEGKTVRQALPRSWALVRGSSWRVLGIFIAASMAQYLVYAIPSGVIGALLGGIGALIAPGSLFAITIASSVIGALFGILSTPVIPTVSTLLYYDLRIRKEGFDLQVLADRLSETDLRPAEGKP